MVSKKQRDLLVKLQTFLQNQQWGKAKNLLKDIDDSNGLGFAKIFIGIETDDQDLVTVGIEQSKQVLGKSNQLVRRPEAHYNLGNAYHYLIQKETHNLKTHFDAKLIGMVHSCIKNFKQALGMEGSEVALVNLANFYDEIGRPLEALQQYEKAIRLKPNFGMAIANKAQTIENLAPITSYSTGYAILAHQLYKQAIDNNRDSILSIGGTKALQQFIAHQNGIEQYFKKNSQEQLLTRDLTHKEYSKKGHAKDELSYIEFCLENNLYLNLHIFDLHSGGSIGDTISTAFITSVADEKADTWVKEVFMRLNEIKESYITGRYILWLSQQKTNTMSKISEQSLLVNNLDYTAHNLYTGLLKSAFKEGFSALDKIANTISFYLDLDNSENKINYRNVWYEDLDKEKGFAMKIRVQNYRLFGVYSVIDELGTGPAGTRNSLEHRYQRIGTIGLDEHNAPTFDQFTQDTIEVYFKIKCAIIYLLNFVNSVERQKHIEAIKTGKIVPTMPVVTEQWLDLWQ